MRELLETVTVRILGGVSLLLVGLFACVAQPEHPGRALSENLNHEAPHFVGLSNDVAVLARAPRSGSNRDLLIIRADGSFSRLPTNGRNVELVGSLHDSPVLLETLEGGPFSRSLMAVGEDREAEISSFDRLDTAHCVTAGSCALVFFGSDGNEKLEIFDAESGFRSHVYSGAISGQPRLSHGCDKVAFVEGYPGTEVSLKVAILQSGVTQEIFRGEPWSGISNLNWSPDGELLLFSLNGKMVVVDTSRGGDFFECQTPTLVRPDWSPDGRLIVYSTVGKPAKNRLMMIDLPDTQELLRALGCRPSETMKAR